MCQTFIPLLSKNGRIVNLSSIASQLKFYSTELQARFRDTHATVETLDDIAKEFVRSVEQRNEEESGFGTPRRSYSVSKALVTALTAMLARQHPGLSINCCCPGWVATDMGQLVGSKPPKKPEDGATIPLRLAFGDVGDVTGKYWANSSIRGKGDGEVQEF
jgi:carbonyl reductase 1